jgi:hypothetical protein
MRRNAEYGLTLVGAGWLQLRDLIRPRFPLSRAGEACAKRDQHRSRAMGVRPDLGA